jgi:hypothetical protein
MTTLSDLRVAQPRDFRGNEDRFDYKPATIADLVAVLVEAGATLTTEYRLNRPLNFEPGSYLVFRLPTEET